MDDRFKFRVWDKTYKKMDDIYFLVEADTGKIFKDTHDLPLGRDVDEVEKDRYILMQSTGLKDKNGKLIYEGDIVDYSSKTKYVIQWDFSGWFLFDYIDGIGCNEYSLINHDRMEIIGNIHKHPNLLS